jgi:hypothetical protein
MRRPIRIPNLGGARAVILHRPHPTVTALTRQLTAIGLDVAQAWPELGPDGIGAKTACSPGPRGNRPCR